MKKKIMAMLLTLVMIVTFMPTMAFAAGTPTAEGQQELTTSQSIAKDDRGGVYEWSKVTKTLRLHGGTITANHSGTGAAFGFHITCDATIVVEGDTTIYAGDSTDDISSAILTEGNKLEITGDAKLTVIAGDCSSDVEESTSTGIYCEDTSSELTIATDVVASAEPETGKEAAGIIAYNLKITNGAKVETYASATAVASGIMAGYISADANSEVNAVADDSERSIGIFAINSFIAEDALVVAQSGKSSSADACSTAICAYDELYTYDSLVYAESDEASGDSMGIQSSDIYLEDSSVMTIAGDAVASSEAIYTEYIGVNDTYLFATAGSAVNSIGIFADDLYAGDDGYVEINNRSVVEAKAKSGKSCAGIAAEGEIFVKNSTVSAEAGYISADSENVYGIVSDEFEAKSSDINCVVGDATYQSIAIFSYNVDLNNTDTNLVTGAAPYQVAGIESYYQDNSIPQGDEINILNGSLKIKTGESAGYTYGIYGMSDITITNTNVDITAGDTTGDSAFGSYGIQSDGGSIYLTTDEDDEVLIKTGVTSGDSVALQSFSEVFTYPPIPGSVDNEITINGKGLIKLITSYGDDCSVGISTELGTVEIGKSGKANLLIETDDTDDEYSYGILAAETYIHNGEVKIKTKGITSYDYAAICSDNIIIKNEKAKPNFVNVIDEDGHKPELDDDGGYYGDCLYQDNPKEYADIYFVKYQPNPTPGTGGGSTGGGTTTDTYTVTFNANGHGTAPAGQTVNAGEKAKAPTAPTATGLAFAGWYTDAACTTKYDFNSTVNANITLYAKWVEGAAAEDFTIGITATSGGDINNPTIKVNGKTLVINKDYTVTIDQDTNTVVVKGLGEYASLNKTIKIKSVPKKMTMYSAASKAKGKLTIKWNKLSNVDGYQVKVALDSKFKKSPKTLNTKSGSVYSKTFSSLKSGKKYYAKVRAFTKIANDNQPVIKIYGAWSKVWNAGTVK